MKRPSNEIEVIDGAALLPCHQLEDASRCIADIRRSCLDLIGPLHRPVSMARNARQYNGCRMDSGWLMACVVGERPSVERRARYWTQTETVSSSSVDINIGISTKWTLTLPLPPHHQVGRWSLFAVFVALPPLCCCCWGSSCVATLC